MMPVSLFRSQYSVQSVRFSPFRRNVLACGSAQHFGMAGNGRQDVLELPAAGTGVAQVVQAFETKEAVFDCAWSEANEAVLASAGGSGVIRLWDLSSPMARGQGQGAAVELRAHKKEAASIDWNSLERNLLASTSWDSFLIVWDVLSARPLVTVQAHNGVAYQASWHPRKPRTLATCGADGTIAVIDIGQAGTQGPAASASVRLKAHDGEILALDWNKYREHEVASAGTDSTIRIFDIRNPQRPLSILKGHSMAVRKVRWSPHFEQTLASCSYDMSVAVWDALAGAVLKRFDHHSEFVVGLDWSLFDQNVLATASWDRMICVWNVLKDPPPPSTRMLRRTIAPPAAPMAPSSGPPNGQLQTGSGSAGLPQLQRTNAY